MEENHLRLLVKRYLSKKSTDEELEVFVSLMKSGKLDKYIQEEIDNDINVESSTELHSNFPTGFDNRFSAGLDSGFSTGNNTDLPTGLETKFPTRLDSAFLTANNTDYSADIDIDLPKKKRIGFILFRWPVAAALIFALSMLTYFSINRHPNINLAKTREININNLTAAITKTILPDGSTVWLNPKATLSYPSKFGKTRDVTMRGEAFFEVTKDHAHPFIVTSGKVLTKVWGTSFRIRAISGEKNTQVSVLTGKVSVMVPVQPQQNLNQHASVSNNASSVAEGSNLAEVILMPDEEVTYKTQTHSLLKAKISPASDLVIWRKANLSFDNTTLDSITTALSQYYHVDIKAENKVTGKLRLTADFNDKNMADILTLICRLLHTSYTKNDNTIILKTQINN